MTLDRDGDCGTLILIDHTYLYLKRVLQETTLYY